MAKKPATLQGHLEQNLKRILKSKRILVTSSMFVEATANPLNFDVHVLGNVRFKGYDKEWSLLFTVRNDKLFDIVYVAPMLEFTSEFDFSASSGAAKTNALEAFKNKQNAEVKRHQDQAFKLLALSQYAEKHHAAVQDVLTQIAHVIRPK